MELITKIKNCFCFKDDQKYYLINFKASKFWVFDYELYDPSKDISKLDNDIVEKLIYEGVIEENPYYRRIRPINGYYPTEATFLLSSECNLNCKYCYAENEQHLYLEENNAETAVDFLIKNACKLKKDKITINFHGVGEPTLNQKVLKKIYCYANQKARNANLKVEFKITTNGVMNQQLRKWLSKNMSLVIVSWDGWEDIQNNQRAHSNLNSYKQVKETVNLLIKNNTNVGIRTTVTNENVSDLAEWTKFLADIGVDYVSYEPVNISGASFENGVEDISSKAFVSNYLKAKQIENKYGINVYYSTLELEQPIYYHCGAYGTNFVLTPKGEVSLCYEVFTKEHDKADLFIVGEVNGERVEINKHKLEQLKSSATAERNKCNNCFAHYHCGGGCLLKRSFSKARSTEKSVKNKCQINKQLLLKKFKQSIRRKHLKVNSIYSFKLSMQ
ncbi:MAG: radical SAM protein [Bacillota bacterium]